MCVPLPAVAGCGQCLGHRAGQHFECVSSTTAALTAGRFRWWPCSSRSFDSATIRSTQILYQAVAKRRPDGQRHALLAGMRLATVSADKTMRIWLLSGDE
jgi:hypothetical protein